MSQEARRDGSDGTALVVVIDDDDDVRGAIGMILEVIGYRVIGTASAGDGVAIVRDLQPDAVVTDCRMPVHDGLWVVSEIRASNPEIPVIMLSSYDSMEYVEGALSRGAAGYILKNGNLEELRRALEAAASGTTYFSPAVAGRIPTPRPRSRADEVQTVDLQESLSPAG